MKPVLLLFLISFGLAACSSDRIISSGELPLYGNDPLSHTVYLGSDSTHHHFALQNGKIGSRVMVPVDDAVIRPEAYPLGTSTGRFVQSASPGEIHLLVLQLNR